MARPKKDPLQAHRERVIDSMTALAALPEFEKFMDDVKIMKDSAVEWWTNHDTVRDQRESLAARGEVRAYLWMLHTYEAQKELLEAQQKAMAEQRQNPQG